MHVPNPKHPNLHSFAPPFSAFAALQSDIPSYSYLFLALWQLPLQSIFATSLSPQLSLTPIICAILLEQSLPPTGHPFVGALPSTIAFASPPQPGNPHPPQLAPGSTSSIFSTLSSTSTANFFEAYARIAPNINPNIPNTNTELSIDTYFTPSIFTTL